MAEPATNQLPSLHDEPVDPISPADLNTMMTAHGTPGPYTLGPDSIEQEEVPRGEITKYHAVSETIYPGVGHDYWVYVPEQYARDLPASSCRPRNRHVPLGRAAPVYDGSKPACLMVFQDGPLYLAPEANIPVAFDNLIHKGEMPVTIGVFVAPGDKGPGLPRWGGTDNRSIEYDSLGDRYSRFLLEEILPSIESQYKIVSEPAGRAICGISSGGICAFNVGWERPDQFCKVVCHCGSFTSIRGGNLFPSIIRKNPAKPLRVFLQTGTYDLDVIFGNWPIANQDMAAALAYRQYDHRLVIGEGGHSLVHGASIFPDTMRWLWRDYPI